MSAQDQMRMVKAEIAALQKATPSLTFVKAWRKVQAKSPELFNRVEAEVSAEIAAMIARQKTWGDVTVQGGFCSNIWTGEAV